MPKRPSGPSGKHTSIGLMVRVSATQKRRWLAAAGKDRRNLSDWIRTRLDDCSDAELGEKRPVQ